ncbi:MAG: 50S ribosomal protein L35 [Epsilonproteobacteria bacterium]|nr:50S ribosomal protein L35 [Campylobacterota bacterium]|tara:strand:+ start:2290 stop:2484 length:195 start_codon:yes stop_codon:yes gene_type:complete
MPKMKTHSASKKRFKKRKNSIKFAKAFKRHLLTKKSTKRKRNLRRVATISSCDEARVMRLLPNS